MQLLRHFVPDTDLNLGTIKRILAQVEGQRSDSQLESSKSNNSTVVSRPQGVESRNNVRNKSPEADDGSIVLEDTGCMIIDPSGKYRPLSSQISPR